MNDIIYDPCPPPPPPEEYCPPPETAKGNNGWGNGIDPTNPGSDNGNATQVSTKLNQSILDRFIGRFTGR